MPDDPQRSPFAGPVPALVTPMTDQGVVDLATFERVVDRAFDHGATCVLVCGSTGEGPLLPVDDRVRLVRRAVDAAGGQPVLACVAGLTVDDLHRDVDRAAGAGATAVLALAPFYFPLAPSEQVDVHTALADRSPVPLLVYHIPQLTGSALDVAATVELAAHPNVAGMKDSSGDLARLRDLVTATAEADFAVFQGNGPLMRPALDAGAAGSITAVANVRPRTVTALHAAVAAGDRAAAERLQDELTAVSAVLDAAPGPLAVAVKAAMELDGELPSRACVPPLRALDRAAVDELRAGLRATRGDVG